MSSIVPLIILQLSWLIAYHVVVLHKNSSKSLTSCISTHHKIFFRICNLQYWCTCENILQLLEAFFTPRCPFKFYSLLFQRSDWVWNLGKYFNGPPIITNKTQKNSHICYILCIWLVHNGFNIFWINWYSFLGSNVTQIMNLIFVKVTFS